MGRKTINVRCFAEQFFGMMTCYLSPHKSLKCTNLCDDIYPATRAAHTRAQTLPRTDLRTFLCQPAPPAPPTMLIIISDTQPTRNPTATWPTPQSLPFVKLKTFFPMRSSD